MTFYPDTAPAGDSPLCSSCSTDGAAPPIPLQASAARGRSFKPTSGRVCNATWPHARTPHAQEKRPLSSHPSPPRNVPTSPLPHLLESARRREKIASATT
jgi:hypothetical protein